jgi:hypothetical protein
MILEWAINCLNVTEGPDGGLNIEGLGRNGFMIEDALPVSVPIPVVVCLRPESEDEADVAYGLNFRVLDPHGVVIDHRRTGVEWGTGTAPQLVDPERYYTTLSVEVVVQESGQYAIVVWLDGKESIRIPLSFSTLSL